MIIVLIVLVVLFEYEVLICSLWSVIAALLRLCGGGVWLWFVV